MEKFCPVCSRVYGEEASHCEVDGERLVILTEEPSLVGHVLDGKYTLVLRIGEGGMGSVYAAEQSSMGREVAIKVLRREFSQNKLAIKRFLREARAASKLAHPNTITVHDFGQSNDGLLYLVMERLTGRPLADILDDLGALPVERAVHILAQVCDSLSEAHAHGITHRDLKPENIFIEQKVGNTDFVKVLDFGIAKMAGDEVTQATATGMICGTPSYMSPEQAMGRELDGRSDIYALGVLLYEMLTDAKPFDGDTPMEVMLKHINEPPPNVYEHTGIRIPQGVQDTVDQMLGKQPEDRPPHCQAVKQLLLDGLETPLAGPPVEPAVEEAPAPRRPREDTGDGRITLEMTGLSPAVVPAGPQLRRRSSRRAWALVAALILAVGAGALGFYLSQGGQGAAPGRAPGPAPRVEAPAALASEAASPHAQRPTDPDGATGPTGPTAPAEADLGEPALEVMAAGEHVGALVDGLAERIFALDEAAVIPPEPAVVTLTIRSDPSGATVFEGAEALGVTPLSLERTPNSGPVTVTLRLARYQPRTIEMGTDASMVYDAALVRARPVRTQGRAQPEPRETGRSPGGPEFGGTF